MRWTTEARIQRTLATVPGGRRLYYLGQRLLGGLRHFTIDQKVSQGITLLDALLTAGGQLRDQRVVEIGTGWAPVLPLLWWLFGRGRLDSYDVTRLLRPALATGTGRQLAAWSADPRIADLTPFARHILVDAAAVAARFPPQRLAAVHRLAEGGGTAVLAATNTYYHAPVDTTALPLPDQAADILYSNAVLEHIPQRQLPLLMAEMYRVLRPGGWLVHQIDPGDHFAHGDPSISPINFLKFSEKAFERYNNSLLFQNRIRAPVYRHYIEMAGFTIVQWDTFVHPAAQAALPNMTIDPQFARYDTKALCTTALRVVARRRTP